MITEGETREREEERERVYTYAKKATVCENGDAGFAATAASNTMTFEILSLLFRQQKLNSLALIGSLMHQKYILKIYSLVGNIKMI